MKARTTLSGELRGVDSFAETPEASFEFGNGHLCRMEIHIEQCTKLPCFFVQESLLALEAVV
jgi:hypothetical protein